MGATVAPRVVVVTRHTEYELLLARHATREQARFFLKGRGQALEPIEERHAQQAEALATVLRFVPPRWRRSRVDRADLDRFLFEPADLVVAVGQDGLVANLAKYLDGQAVIGINPDPARYDGVLVPHAPGVAGALLDGAAAGQVPVELRTMAEARFDDGQRLVALNELFIGHRSHQSARYRLCFDFHEERQSSSGIIISTGTGATGWARSVCLRRETGVALPRPADAALAFFVREAFPSVATGTNLTDGRIEEAERLEVVSEMNDGGVVFGDGIEDDRVEFHFGMRVEVAVAARRLRLVRG